MKLDENQNHRFDSSLAFPLEHELESLKEFRKKVLGKIS